MSVQTNKSTFFTPLRKALLAIMFVIGFSSQQANAQYVYTQGNKIYDPSGNELFFSGMNLGGWLLWEGYLMMGQNGYMTHSQFYGHLANAWNSNSRAQEFEHQWRLNFVNARAISDLKNLGFNSVRVPFHYNMFWSNGQLSNHGFQYLDRVIELCRQNDMWVLLDMHAAPGYQNPGDHSDNPNSSDDNNAFRHTVEFFDENKNNVQIASRVWRHIANRYKNETAVWGYDLINEPQPREGDDYKILKAMVQMRNAIREVDNNHIIVAEGAWWGSDISKIDWQNAQVQQASGVSSRWDSKLVYQTHHYGDASILDTEKRHEITNRLGIPLIMGEYGELPENEIRGITEYSKKHTAGYFPWTFKKLSRDRTLWTIPSNNAWDRVRNFIRNGGSRPTDTYNDFINFAQSNILNGHSSHQWHQGFYDAVKPGGVGNVDLCQNASSKSIPGRIQAESYCDQSGVQNESTTDTGGGQNIGYIDAGDWVKYKINVPSTKTYNIEFRVASPVATGKFNVYLDGANLKSVTVPNTGGWQTWRTINTSVSLSAGNNKSLELRFTGEGLNLNWINITETSTNPPTPTNPCNSGTRYAIPGTVQAENYCDQKGIRTQDTSDSGGGENVGWTHSGDYTKYRTAVDGAGDYTIKVRVASPNSDRRIAVKFSGNVVATINVPNTGGWQNWRTVEVNAVLPNGNRTVQVDYSTGGINLNWIRFEKAGNSNPPTSGTITNGTYRITNRQSGKVLDVDGGSHNDGANVQQWESAGNDQQKWIVEDKGNGRYEIRAFHSGKCLDTDTGNNNIQQWSCSDANNQRWSFVSRGSGFYQIRSSANSRVVEVSGGSSSNGANIWNGVDNNSHREHWTLQRL